MLKERERFLVQIDNKTNDIGEKKTNIIQKKFLGLNEKINDNCIGQRFILDIDIDFDLQIYNDLKDEDDFKSFQIYKDGYQGVQIKGRMTEYDDQQEYDDLLDSNINQDEKTFDEKGQKEFIKDYEQYFGSLKDIKNFTELQRFKLLDKFIIDLQEQIEILLPLHDSTFSVVTYPKLLKDSKISIHIIFRRIYLFELGSHYDISQLCLTLYNRIFRKNQSERLYQKIFDCTIYVNRSLKSIFTTKQQYYDKENHIQSKYHFPYCVLHKRQKLVQLFKDCFEDNQLSQRIDDILSQWNNNKELRDQLTLFLMKDDKPYPVYDFHEYQKISRTIYKQQMVKNFYEYNKFKTMIFEKMKQGHDYMCVDNYYWFSIVYYMSQFIHQHNKADLEQYHIFRETVINDICEFSQYTIFAKAKFLGSTAYIKIMKMIENVGASKQYQHPFLSQVYLYEEHLSDELQQLNSMLKTQIRFYNQRCQSNTILLGKQYEDRMQELEESKKDIEDLRIKIKQKEEVHHQYKLYMIHLGIDESQTNNKRIYEQGYYQQMQLDSFKKLCKNVQICNTTNLSQGQIYQQFYYDNNNHINICNSGCNGGKTQSFSKYCFETIIQYDKDKQQGFNLLKMGNQGDYKQKKLNILIITPLRNVCKSIYQTFIDKQEYLQQIECIKFYDYLSTSQKNETGFTTYKKGIEQTIEIRMQEQKIYQDAISNINMQLHEYKIRNDLNNPNIQELLQQKQQLEKEYKYFDKDCPCVYFCGYLSLTKIQNIKYDIIIIDEYLALMKQIQNGFQKERQNTTFQIMQFLLNKCSRAFFYDAFFEYYDLLYMQESLNIDIASSQILFNQYNTFQNVQCNIYEEKSQMTDILTKKLKEGHNCICNCDTKAYAKYLQEVYQSMGIQVFMIVSQDRTKEEEKELQLFYQSPIKYLHDNQIQLFIYSPAIIQSISLYYSQQVLDQGYKPYPFQFSFSSLQSIDSGDIVQQICRNRQLQQVYQFIQFNKVKDIITSDNMQYGKKNVQSSDSLCQKLSIFKCELKPIMEGTSYEVKKEKYNELIDKIISYYDQCYDKLNEEKLEDNFETENENETKFETEIKINGKVLGIFNDFFSIKDDLALQYDHIVFWFNESLKKLFKALQYKDTLKCNQTIERKQILIHLYFWIKQRILQKDNNLYPKEIYEIFIYLLKEYSNWKLYQGRIKEENGVKQQIDVFIKNQLQKSIQLKIDELDLNELKFKINLKNQEEQLFQEQVQEVKLNFSKKTLFNLNYEGIMKKMYELSIFLDKLIGQYEQGLFLSDLDLYNIDYNIRNILLAYFNQYIIQGQNCISDFCTLDKITGEEFIIQKISKHFDKFQLVVQQFSYIIYRSTQKNTLQRKFSSQYCQQQDIKEQSFYNKINKDAKEYGIKQNGTKTEYKKIMEALQQQRLDKQRELNSVRIKFYDQIDDLPLTKEQKQIYEEKNKYAKEIIQASGKIQRKIQSLKQTLKKNWDVKQIDELEQLYKKYQNDIQDWDKTLTQEFNKQNISNLLLKYKLDSKESLVDFLQYQEYLKTDYKLKFYDIIYRSSLCQFIKENLKLTFGTKRFETNNRKINQKILIFPSVKTESTCIFIELKENVKQEQLCLSKGFKNKEEIIKEIDNQQILGEWTQEYNFEHKYKQKLITGVDIQDEEYEDNQMKNENIDNEKMLQENME